MGIKIDDICFEYERGTAMQVTALDHISAEIPDNQFIGLIGHTGSGKSTLVQTLNGLLKPTSGHIYYNGEDISGEKFDKKKLRADVGLVFQYPEHQLFEIDVLTDVMFGPKNLGLSDAEAKKRALEALESVHMPEKYYKSSPFDLSGNLNMTIILVSHSMDDVARYVDRIMVMGGGKLLYDDEPVKVFRHVQELENLGLAAPQITYIMKLLKEKGLDVSTDALTVEQAAAEIMAHRRELHV